MADQKTNGDQRFYSPAKLMEWLAAKVGVGAMGGESLGQWQISHRLDITTKYLAEASRESLLPAKWYGTLCDLAGEDLPRGLFRWAGQ